MIADTSPSIASEDSFDACPMCKNGTFILYPDMRDDRYGYPRSFAIRRCSHCGHSFIPASFEPDQLRQLYTNYYPRGRLSVDGLVVPEVAHGFRSWLQGERCSAFRWVPPGVRVLDIGCGFAETLLYHRGRGCEAWGVEADENVRRVADRFQLNVHVGLFDASQFEKDYFDYVTLDQVIEHTVNPREVMQGIARVLKPGGTAIVGTPNSGGWGARIFGRKWINWHVPYHLQQFSRRSMAILAREAGLEIHGTKTVANSEWLYYQWLHLVTYPGAGYSSPFWDPAKSKFTTPQAPQRVLGLLHRLKTNHFLTRIADALGVGDNFLFFLRKPIGA